MNLYVSHASGFDYKNELYTPLKDSIARDHDLFFPHDSEEATNTKNTLDKSDIVLAEVSFPSTGQGIELGWADASGVRIICFYKSGATPSSSIKLVSSHSFEYESAQDMVKKLESLLSSD